VGKRAASQPVIEVRDSPLHGKGVFALRRIAKRTRVIEYLGERVSHREDAGVDGNEARFVNHACEPNCESVIEERRVFIDALRTIEPGEELNYDYQIQRAADDPPEVGEIFGCRCGLRGCRGTMLYP
jgi:uncharacterized protein